VLGVATAVSVLAGALLVGHSVRGSLADLTQQRLGAADLVIASPVFVRERLAADIAADPRFGAVFKAAAPLIMADAVVTEQDSGRRAGHVTVYGIDDRFWRFHGVAPVAIGDREAALSPALAREIGARPDAAILVRVQRPSDIPLESLQSRKEDLGRTLRLTTRAILEPSSLGEFSLKAEQGDVMAVFVPLDRLRAELEVGERVNTILVSRSDPAGGSEALDAILAEVVAPDDVGLIVRVSDDQRVVIVESSASLMDDRQAAAVEL
jgi:putative ABC transport system permease protein